MFPKAATVLTVNNPQKLQELTEERLEQHEYRPIEGYSALSQGFSRVSVDKQLLYRYGGYGLLHFTIQKKSVPGSAVKEALLKACQALEEENGHYPGKKMQKEVRERVTEELIARAVPSTTVTPIFLDFNGNRVIVGSASQNVLECISSYLYQGAEIELTLAPMPGRKVVTAWLKPDLEEDEEYFAEDYEDNLPTGLVADNSIVFEHPGNSGKVVKYQNTNLEDADVIKNLLAGAMVDSVALTFDSKLSFTLSDGRLKGLKALDVLNEKPTNKEDAFQNAFYLAASELFGLADFMKDVA